MGGGGKEKKKEKRKGNAIERNEISRSGGFTAGAGYSVRAWVIIGSKHFNFRSRDAQLNYNLGIPIVMYQ